MIGVSYTPVSLSTLNSFNASTRVCQRADWKARHKSICGKKLSFDEIIALSKRWNRAMGTSVVPYRSDGNIPLAAPAFSRPYEVIIQAYNLKKRPDYDYVLLDTLSETLEPIFLSRQEEYPWLRRLFLDARDKALASSDPISVACVFLCLTSPMHGTPELSERLRVQFRREYDFDVVPEAEKILMQPPKPEVVSRLLSGQELADLVDLFPVLRQQGII